MAEVSTRLQVSVVGGGSASQFIPDGATALHPSAAETATDTGTIFDCRKLRGKYVTVDPDITASGGTSPTLDLFMAFSDDGSNFTRVQDSVGTDFAQEVGVADPDAKDFLVAGDYLRLEWDITGSAGQTFTFVAPLS